MPRDLSKFMPPDLVDSKCTECGAEIPAKSYAAHFTGLCCGVEYNGAPSVYAALQKWLNGPVEGIGITRPTEPEYRGALTIRNAYDIKSDAEFAARLREWAREVWAAYAPQHELARSWIEKALGE